MDKPDPIDTGVRIERDLRYVDCYSITELPGTQSAGSPTASLLVVLAETVTARGNGLTLEVLAALRDGLPLPKWTATGVYCPVDEG